MLLVALLVSAALAANEPDCGTKGPSSAVSRIIAGQNAKPHEFPWQCSLQLWKMHNCGASILNKRWLLTAGHCTSPDDQLEVLCGKWAKAIYDREIGIFLLSRRSQPRQT